MRLKRSINNIFYGVISQIIILSLGFIIPSMFIKEYGSDINGLFSSITQIFSFIALLEAGLGAATVQALYKPIVDCDKDEISAILSATNKYYKKISIYYIICVILLSIIYPILIKSDINYIMIASIIFIQGIVGAINFYFQATIKQLIIAEGKNYVISNINLIIQLILSFFKIIIIYNTYNIIYIQIALLFVNIIQIIIYYLYFKKKYYWVNLGYRPKFSALNQKNSFLIHQVSLLIFSSTDTMILSIFCDLKVASVYAVYSLVIGAINTIINIINNSTFFILGQKYHENKEEYIRLHDIYDNCYICFAFAITSICYILFIPFIRLYTNGSSDISYVDKYLPILFCLVQLLTSSRMVSNNLIRISGHMKKTIPKTIIESTINLIVSLVLVNIVGIYGVLLGTIVALIYRTNDIIIYANKNILKRSSIKTYKSIIINSFLFILICICNEKFKIIIDSYIDFAKAGIFISIIIFTLFITVNILLNVRLIMKLVYKIKYNEINRINI